MADMLYNGHQVIADTVLRNRSNDGQTLIERPLYQFVIFKSLSHCFEATIGFDVKASFASRPNSRLIR